MTRATITNKQTGAKLEGEYSEYSEHGSTFEFRIDGTGIENVMKRDDWNVEEEKPQKFAEALALIEAELGDTYRRWSEEVRTNKTAGTGEKLDLDIRHYTMGWTSLYRRIKKILEDAE